MRQRGLQPAGSPRPLPLKCVRACPPAPVPASPAGHPRSSLAGGHFRACALLRPRPCAVRQGRACLLPGALLYRSCIPVPWLSTKARPGLSFALEVPAKMPTPRAPLHQSSSPRPSVTARDPGRKQIVIAGAGPVICGVFRAGRSTPSRAPLLLAKAPARPARHARTIIPRESIATHTPLRCAHSLRAGATIAREPCASTLPAAAPLPGFTCLPAHPPVRAGALAAECGCRVSRIPTRRRG